MRRHGRALGLLLTSAAVVAAGLVATPAGTSSAAGRAPQVVYIDANHHLMVGAVDGSDRPRALASGLTTFDAWLSPSGATVSGFFRQGGTYALLLRTRSRSSTTIVSSHFAWTVRPYDGGGALFLDGSAGVYDVSSSGTVTRRPVSGLLYEPEGDEHPDGIRTSPARTKVAYWLSGSTVDDCAERLVVKSLFVDKAVSRAFGDPSTCYTRGQVLGWLDDDTLLYSYPAAQNVSDPQESVVYALDVWPRMASTPVDTGLRGITRIEHWGTQWWFWRDRDLEYGVSRSALVAPTSWATLPAGMTIVGTVTSDPPLIGATISNRMATRAHAFAKPSRVTVGSSPYAGGYAYYGVDPPGWTLPYGSTRLDYATGTGTLSVSQDAGATWRTVASTSSGARLPALTHNVWLRWSHPGGRFTRPSTSSVFKVTAVPVITVSETTSSTSSATRIHGTVTRVGGTARLLRWTGSTWLLVNSAWISSTGRFDFGWHVFRHGRYRVSVPATTYWGGATRTWDR